LDASQNDCLKGGGRMGALMRSINWAETPLGAVESWPDALRWSVALALNSSFPTAICWGEDLRLLYNDAYRVILGTKHPKSLGQPCRECWSEIWDVVALLLLQPLKGGPASSLNDFLLEMDRHGYVEETYFVASYSPIPDGERIGGVLVTCYEVTEQVVSERRLRTLGELSIQLNEQAGEDQVCRAAARILGGNDRDVPFAMIYLLEGETARLRASAGLDGISPAAAETIAICEGASTAWPLAEVVKSGRSLVVDDLERRFGPIPAGQWTVPTRTALLLPIGSADDTTGCYGVLVAGVSPRRKLDESYRGFLELAADRIATALRKGRAREEERRRAEALARADRAKDEFLAMLGHELRNPLSPIRTVLQLMRLRREPALQRERAIIERHVQHVERLVDDLLDVSRLTHGRVQLERKIVDLADIMARAIEMSAPIIEERFHQLSIEASRGTIFVNGDAIRLAQVVANLLINAAKYTEARGRIEVRCARIGDHAVIAVKDNGQGIDPGLAAHIFDPFLQGPSGSAKPGGLGLGLAIAKSLVSMHNGTIEVLSAGSGHGSEFVVRLPAAQRQDQAEQPPPAACSLEPVTPQRIMIVDDNQDAAQLLAETLQLAGHDVQVAYDAPSALESVSDFAPEVIVMDIGLPVMDGYELARAIRGMPEVNPPRLIALTGYAQESDRSRALEAGFSEHLVKPIDIERLLSAIHPSIG
jgi:signal transduction histidine kinase/CheY-like chemotaxis protein